MKVAYFDYWTLGIHHFVGIDAALRARGIETVFLHIGSLRAKTVAEEVVRGVRCRDISYYKTRWIYEMLRQERPDVVVTLNTTLLTDRALVLAARALGIRTVHLMHGSLIGGDDPALAVDAENSRFQNLSKKLRKAVKYVSWVIPNYLYSSARARRKMPIRGRPFRVIWRFATNPGRELSFPSFPQDCVHDKALVYSTSDADLFEKMGYSRDRIVIVGNPKYDSILERLGRAGFAKDHLPEDLQRKLGAHGRYVVIIDDGLPNSTPLFGWTHEYRNKFHDDVSAVLERQGYLTVIKAHPGTRMSDLRKPDRDTVFLYQQLDFDTLIYFAEFCVCHMSTAITNCVLLDRPVLTPTWGPSGLLPRVRIKQGIAVPWPSLDVEPAPVMNREAREEFKRTHITVLTPTAITSVVRELTQWNAAS
jgi:hypothetical protein